MPRHLEILPPRMPAWALTRVPALPLTLMGLELLLRRPAFDLSAATRLINADPGAVLAVFGLLAEEVADAAERPARLNDCIANLSPHQLVLALAEGQGDRNRHAALAHFAAHGVAVGHAARSVAETLGLPGEQAYLVGLLHELGCLPVVLGWRAAPAAVACDEIARRYALPEALRSALHEVHRECAASVWTAMVAAAHDLLREA